MLWRGKPLQRRGKYIHFSLFPFISVKTEVFHQVLCITFGLGKIINMASFYINTKKASLCFEAVICKLCENGFVSHVILYAEKTISLLFMKLATTSHSLARDSNVHI
jgi:hypothetical protein